MKLLLKTALAVACIAWLGAGCSRKNVDEIKAKSAEVWDKNGFHIVGYEGFQYSAPGGTWGGKVWYIVKKKDGGSTLYHGFISKWGDEYHIYSLSAIDALKGSEKP